MKLTNRLKMKYLLELYSEVIKPGDKILDVGSGDGYVSYLIGYYTASDIVGIDTVSYNKYLKKFNPFNGRDIPFKDKYFDIVMLNSMFHHIKKADQKYLLKEAMRVSEKILIFDIDLDRTNKLVLYSFDYLLNKLTHLAIHVPLNFVSFNLFRRMFKSLDLEVKEFKRVKTAGYYPVNHIFFYLESK